VSDVSGQANWLQLFRVACAILRQANSKQLVIDHWTFGGGTALMLQLDHRESHDIDIFLNDPQQLPFLDPQKQDFRFDIQLEDYEGDGARPVISSILPQLGKRTLMRSSGNCAFTKPRWHKRLLPWQRSIPSS
jgi:hypothetical protein